MTSARYVWQMSKDARDIDAFLNNPALRAPMKPDEVEQVIALLKEGHEWKDGQFTVFWFDQGRSGTSVITEQQLREQIVMVPSTFRCFLFYTRP